VTSVVSYRTPFGTSSRAFQPHSASRCLCGKLQVNGGGRKPSKPVRKHRVAILRNIVRISIDCGASKPFKRPADKSIRALRQFPPFSAPCCRNNCPRCDKCVASTPSNLPRNFAQRSTMLGIVQESQRCKLQGTLRTLCHLVPFQRWNFKTTHLHCKSDSATLRSSNCRKNWLEMVGYAVSTAFRALSGRTSQEAGM
jgi:hypothetical protein